MNKINAEHTSRDTVVMIWDEAITEPFCNAHTRFADPDENFEEQNFHKSKNMLRDLKARTEMEKKDITPRLLEALLQNIAPNQLGVYNMFYRNSLYVHGLDHPTTARLGHMCVRYSGIVGVDAYMRVCGTGSRNVLMRSSRDW
jgi:hypothetical protein